MESSSLKVNVEDSRQSSKRLLFDHRYGWVIDEWKHPVEETLDGGRGMFSIIPLTKVLVQMASQTIKLTVTSVRKAAEDPQILQSSLENHAGNFTESLKIGGGKGFKNPSKNSQSHPSSSSSLFQTEKQ